MPQDDGEHESNTLRTTVQLPADDRLLRDIWAHVPAAATAVLLASATHDDFPWELAGQLARQVPCGAPERVVAAPAVLNADHVTVGQVQCAVVVGRLGVTTDADVTAVAATLAGLDVPVLGTVVASSSPRRWRSYRRFAARFGYRRDPLRPWPAIEAIDRGSKA